MSDEKKEAEVRHFALGDELSVCDSCGYEGGFHGLFRRVATTRSESVKMLLKCPGCGHVYDLDLVIGCSR